jgi:hypothetical protein
MAADMSDDRAMISEKVAATLVSRVLNSFDLVVIFVALVLFMGLAPARPRARAAAAGACPSPAAHQ